MPLLSFPSGVKFLSQLATLPSRDSKMSGRPKILLIENSLHVTGAFKASLAIASALRADHEIEFLIPERSTLRPVVESQGVICHQMPMLELGRSWSKVLRYLPMLWINTIRLRKLLSANRVDILIVNDYYNLLGAMTKMTGWSGRLLTVIRLLPRHQNRILNHAWSFLALNASEKVVVVSQAVKAQLPRSNKIRVIYSALKPPGDYLGVINRSAPPEAVKCLYLANYIAGKGHQFALQAFARAYKVNPLLRLYFFGGDMGLQKNLELKLALQQQVLTMGLHEVVSVGDFTEDIEKEIKSADIVLNFSEAESFSFTCLEASACGRPVIASRCGGPEEIIQDGVSGLLAPVGDVDAMADAILALSQSEDLRQSMGSAGRAIALRKFSVKRFTDDFRSVCAS